MSYDAEKWARSQTVGNARSKFVLVELANCFNSDSGLCCPSIAHLCKVTEMTESTVLKAVKHLVSLGLISKKVVPTETGRGGVYTLHFDKSVTPKNEDTPKFKDTPKTDRTDTPKFKGVTSNKNKEILIKEKDKKEKLSCPDGISDQVFKEWVQYKKSKSKICTQRMVDAIVRESEKAGIGAEDAMIYQMEQGWQGFNAEWYRNKMGNNSRTKRGVAKPEKDYTNVEVPNGGGSISDFFNF